MGRYCRHKKPKTATDIVAHFQRRCMERIGFILKQRVLKELKEKKLLSVLEKQSNIKTMYRLRREMYNDGKQMLQKDVIVVYDKARKAFVTTYAYDEWVKNHWQKAADRLTNH